MAENSFAMLTGPDALAAVESTHPQETGDV